MSIKADFNMSHECFNQVVGLMKEVCPVDNHVPQKFSNAKKLVKKLGLTMTKIDYCPNVCMLYYKEDSNLETCKFCGQLRRKTRKSSRGKHKDISYARMHYLPLIPRL